MRLWSIHPSYLDSKGLVALWRESLLAQNVLLGKTKGYVNHPQLERFKAADSPLGAMATYLSYVADEADRRNYNFNRQKIIEATKYDALIPVTYKQLQYEFRHLLSKLAQRAPEKYEALKHTKQIKPHPLFKQVKGEIETWERIK